MRRGAHTLLVVAAAPGLLVLGVAVGLALSSAERVVGWSERIGDRRYRIEAVDGRLAVSATLPSSPGHLSVTRWRWGGFSLRIVRDERAGGVLRQWRATLPWWALALAALPLPVWAIAAWPGRRRRARREQGRCARCGYDLRGGGPAGRCPECGEPTPEMTDDTSDPASGGPDLDRGSSGGGAGGG